MAFSIIGYSSFFKFLFVVVWWCFLGCSPTALVLFQSPLMLILFVTSVFWNVPKPFWALSLSKFNPIMIHPVTWLEMIFISLRLQNASLSLNSRFLCESHTIYSWIFNGHFKFNLTWMKFFLFYFQSIPLYSSATQLKSSSPFFLIQFLNRFYCSVSKIDPESHHVSSPLLWFRYPSVWFHCFHSCFPIFTLEFILYKAAGAHPSVNT